MWSSCSFNIYQELFNNVYEGFFSSLFLTLFTFTKAEQ